MNNNVPPEGEEEPVDKKGIPLRWIFYAVLTFAFFQTLYVWWQVRGE